QSSAAAERQAAVEDLLEEFTFLLGGNNLTLAIGRTLQFDMDHPAIAHATNVAHATVVAAIKSIRNPQNRGQRADSIAVRLIESRKGLMTFARLRAAMIARHIGNHVALGL